MILLLMALTLSSGMAVELEMEGAMEPLELEAGFYFRRLYPGSKEIMIVDPTREIVTLPRYSGIFSVPAQITDTDGSTLVPIALWEEIGTDGNFDLIRLPTSVRSIESFCFNWCAITDLELSEGLNTIADYSFREMTGLSTLDLPNTLYKIGDGDFCDTQLKAVNFGEGLRFIGKDSFSSNPLIEEVVFPGYMNRIGEGAFCDLPSLKSVTLAPWLNDLYRNFNDCPEIERIVCQSEWPPRMSECFDKVNKMRCVVTVPQGCLSNYRESREFKDFPHIIERPDSGIEEVSYSSENTDSGLKSIDLNGLPSDPEAPGLHLILDGGECRKVLNP